MEREALTTMTPKLEAFRIGMFVVFVHVRDARNIVVQNVVESNAQNVRRRFWLLNLCLDRCSAFGY
jgi:hypothetical protein